MVDAVTGCAIVFNGEIYNFKALRALLEGRGQAFRGSSDTEVLLQGLVNEGREFLARLQGMYAFAFYDPRTTEVLLARDHLGIKPLYYSRSRDGIIFASEIRAVLNAGMVGRNICREGIYGLFCYGSVQHPHTLFEGVYSLAPGSYLVVRPSGELDFGFFWQFPTPANGITTDVAVAETKETVSLAVKSHLVSDVPVGIFLSAGVDSTIIAGLAAQFSPGIRSFTVGFDNSMDRGELEHAAQFARECRLEHTSLILRDGEAAEDAEHWLSSMDSPSVDGLNTYVISRAIRREGITVALSGLGGDELFCGYSTFGRVLRLLRLQALMPSFLRQQCASLIRCLSSRHPALEKLADLISVNEDAPLLTARTRRLFSDHQLGEFGLTTPRTGGHRADLSAPFSRTSDTISAICQVECLGYMMNTLLRDTDANSMAHSLEVRVPFLDRAVVEFASSLPGNVRYNSKLPGKYLLRAAFSDLLQHTRKQSGKRGFTLPMPRWMRTSMQAMCQQNIDELISRDLLPAAYLQETWRRFVTSGDDRQWSRAMLLVILNSYLRRSLS
jgi:asparagine synthase (glutamine-hydrolysing)